jgi:adenine-specific DNA glycosylase
MELGAVICRPANPDCRACPVRRMCMTKSDALPRPKVGAKTREMRVALLVITDRSGRILMRRESGRLMHAMLHLPHGDTSLLTGRPLRAKVAAPVGSFRHTITNRRVTFTVHPAELKERVGREYTWVDPGEIGKFPHPSYVRKALGLALR